MSNSFFAFKQFTVYQGRCAMKVSTDACIQGAITPVPEGPIRVLDVGAGTGLLSLMIAQRAPQATIDALEIDSSAAAQAAENAAASPFADRIKVHHIDAKAYRSEKLYDLIICNPPFFKRSLLGPDGGRNAARHELFLGQQDLAAILNRHLAHSGTASILWPLSEFREWEQVAEASQWLGCGTFPVKDNDNARLHRIIGMFGRERTPAVPDVVVIKKGDGSYTEQFRNLLAPFYLHL
jgi:tRNA1Val (adenine37-N6)-methyltransferase